MANAFTSNQVFLPIGPEGISVTEFSERLSSFFGEKKLIQIISTPMTGLKGTILEGLEKCKKERSYLSADKAMKIWENIATRADAIDRTQKLEPEIFSLGDREIIQALILNRSLEWTAGKKESLATLITEAKKGASLQGLTLEMIHMAAKTVQAAVKIEGIYGRDAMFDVLTSSFQLNSCVEEQFLQEAAISRLLNEEMSSLEELLDEALAPRLSLEDQVKAFAKEIDGSTLYPSIAVGYTLKDETASQDPRACFQRHLALVQGDMQTFSENYEVELVHNTLNQMEVDYSKPLYPQLTELADQIESDHDNKIDNIIEFFLDDDNGFTRMQKEYVFYSKTLWPGYEDRGAFALFDPKRNDGPINQYDFYLTDAVWDKMLRMADEVEEISEQNEQRLEEIRARLGVDKATKLAADLRIHLYRFEALERPEYLTPSLFTDEEIGSIEAFMQNTSR